MSYLGTPPQSGFITTAKQRVTSSTNAYVDLDHAISSIADVIVFVNFVKQDTTNLTLTTSTRITLGATLVSSDIVEIHYLGKAVNTQTPGTATVTNDMLAGSIANSKLANSSITLNGSAVSLGGSASVDNAPMWVATMSAQQTGGNNAMVKINYNTEVLDTDSAYDTSSYRFTVPSGKAGKYFISAMTNIQSSGSNGARSQTNSIYVNGTSIVRSQYFMTSGNLFEADQDNICHCTLLHDLSVGDYVEVYAKRYSDHSENLVAKTNWSRFMGFKLA